MDYPIQPGDSIVVIGGKGKGKTNLEMGLVDDRPSVVVHDVKRDPQEWATFAGPRGYLVTQDPLLVNRAPLVCFQPDDLAIQDREGWRKPGSVGYGWTEALQRTWNRSKTVVVFTEALQSLPSVGGHPIARKIITQGRSVMLTSMYESQMVSWIDTIALRLADHVFCFGMQDAEQLGRLRSARAVDPSPLAGLPTWWFGYHQQGSPAWIVCPPAPRILSPENAGAVTPAEIAEPVE